MSIARKPKVLSGAVRAHRYMTGVLSGKILACDFVKQCCARHRDDLKRKKFKYRFDEERANEPIRFIEELPHIKGRQFSGRKLVLSDWQCFITAVVFGWVDKKTGFRRFRMAYIEVPRKNGKSSWSAGIGLYLLAADGEDGAEVYSAATGREQARIVWDMARKMVERTPSLRRALGVAAGAHSIFVDRTASWFKALSREQQGNLDGLNIHAAIVDELHAHKDRGIWDVLETGTGARSQPLMWAITTSGSNRSGICYEQRAYVVKILARTHVDETYFGVIYTIDEEDKKKRRKADDWTKPKTWEKANPNWGISVQPDDIERKAVKAMEMASAQNNFLTKHLDKWVNAATAWLNMHAWELCADPALDEADFEGEPVMVALDLASKVDIAAKVKVYKRDLMVKGKMHSHYYAFCRFYIPEDRAEDGGNASYSGWVSEGHLIATPGNVIDFGMIEDDLLEDHRRAQILNAGVDPWQSTQLSQRMTDEGIPMLEYPQTVKNMSEPMKELEKLVLQGRFHHNANPAFTWMMSNVVAFLDAKDNVYPRKEFPENKIDGAVAAIMALGAWLQPAKESTVIPSDYELMTL
jgi:phage terminase large subunit-like protein